MVVFGVLFVIVAAMLGILLTMRNNGVDSGNIGQEFNVYANYLFNGDELDRSIEINSVYNTFYIDEHYMDKDYLERLLNDYNVFYDHAKKKGLDGDNEAMFVLAVDYIKSLIEYSEFSFLDNDVLYDIYLNSGVDFALQKVKDYYGAEFYNKVMDENNANADGNSSSNEQADENKESFLLSALKEYVVRELINRIRGWNGEDTVEIQPSDYYAKTLLYDTRISLKKQAIMVSELLEDQDEGI